MRETVQKSLSFQCFQHQKNGRPVHFPSHFQEMRNVHQHTDSFGSRIPIKTNVISSSNNVSNSWKILEWQHAYPRDSWSCWSDLHFLTGFKVPTSPPSHREFIILQVGILSKWSSSKSEATAQLLGSTPEDLWYDDWRLMDGADSDPISLSVATIQDHPRHSRNVRMYLYTYMYMLIEIIWIVYVRVYLLRYRLGFPTVHTLSTTAILSLLISFQSMIDYAWC